MALSGIAGEHQLAVFTGHVSKRCIQDSSGTCHYGNYFSIRQGGTKQLLFQKLSF